MTARMIAAAAGCAALLVAGCTTHSPRTAAAGSVVGGSNFAGTAAAGTSTGQAAAEPTPNTTWQLRLTSRSTLPEYPATAALVATACGDPRSTWRGTLTFDSTAVSVSDRRREITWTFASNGRAEVPVGPYHATVDGERYTARFIVYLTLLDAGGHGSDPTISVDDIRIHTRRYPDVSMKPFSTNYGVPTKLSKTDGPC